MYTAFYGLREKPFALSPDPRFLYLAGSHREALAHLLYGIEQGEGFISITGEVGTGKTTLCRTLLERLDGEVEVAFLFNPSRSALELLQSICTEFDLPAEGLARRSLMTQLDRFLVEQKRVGRRVLLIIDEAQTLSENTLEQVRLLSNLETSREKLIQILLLGQPELDRKLDDRGLRQLRQRISVRWKLEPLAAAETRAYVRHRLAVAAGEPKDLFSEAALREVHRRTGGIPRLVNQLCDRALLVGYAARAAWIGPGFLRAAAREIPDTQRRRGGTGAFERCAAPRPWLFFAASFALVAFSLFVGLQVGRHGLTDLLRASVFKPAELRADAAGRSQQKAVALAPDRPRTPPPAVGANASASRFPVTSVGALGPVAGPPLIELMGHVPEEVREGLRIDRGAVAATPPRPDSVETALARGLLPKLLATRNARIALSESRSALLARFGRQVPRLAADPRDVEDLRRSFEGRGLTATPFDGGSIELLRRLDHPVVLPLAVRPLDLSTDSAFGTHPGADAERWVAITAFRGDRARVAGLVSGQIVTVAIDELEAHWLETGIIVWERYEAVAVLLVADDEGAGVLWLQRALAELHFFDDSPSGRFDDPTRAAVRRFQSSRGLVSDGIVGPLTQIALYARLSRYPVPRLSESATATNLHSDASANTRAKAGPNADPKIDGDTPPASPGERG
ncbi:MAG: AAA family ATPase [bacterium]|nr:AAA family ATPase [bacterium]